MIQRNSNKMATLPGWNGATIVALSVILLLSAGCGTKSADKQNQSFFTSGSTEADQRASQRMAQQEQLKGTGEGAGETKKGKDKESGSGARDGQVPGKKTLYDRLGGELGMGAIVDDFLPRALQDPRVNWERNGSVRTGLFRHKPSATWKATPENVKILKKHLVEFLSLATGGPAHYEGKEIQSTHSGMRITNPEFDATVGDLKATLDKLQVANTEQKELLAIVESTRAQIVTER